ncbi:MULTISPECIES: CynX/NimT family MFS transporter [Haloarcula]|uniref:MFS transporter n=1 Tax=Haloarcula TaxID=2237 RepID=UPI0023EAE86F|nr:MFS transporter [Halomicroarcula sp. XH51]
MVFLVNLARVVFAPLIEPIRAATGAGDATLGLLATLVWAGSALPRLPTGYLLTRVSRPTVVFGSGVVLTAGATFMALTTDPGLLLVGGFTMGLASGVYLIAANPLITELFPERPGRALGQHGVAAQVAAVVAPPLVSVALVVGTWRTTLRGLAVAAALMTVVFTLVARRAEFPAAGAEDTDFAAAVRAQWRLVLTGVLAIGATTLVWNGVFNFYVTYLGTLSLSGETGRLMLLVVFAAGVPAFYVSGRLADRLPNVPYLLALIVAFTGCILVLPAVGGRWPLVAFSAVLGFVSHSIFPAADTYLLGSLPNQHRASAYAAYSGGMMLIQSLGSVVVGTLLDASVSFPAIFGAMGAGLVVLTGALLVLYAGGRLPTSVQG